MILNNPAVRSRLESAFGILTAWMPRVARLTQKSLTDACPRPPGHVSIAPGCAIYGANA